MYVLPRSITRSGSSGASQRGTLLLTMAVWSAVWAGLYVLATSPVWGAGLDVSRRLANLPYVLWIAAFNTAQLLATCAVDSVFFPAFFTRQTNLNTLHAQLVKWSSLVLSYCQYYRIFKLSLSPTSTTATAAAGSASASNLTSAPASSSSTECPARARSAASGPPPGPEPTTTYSYCWPTTPPTGSSCSRDGARILVAFCW